VARVKRVPRAAAWNLSLTLSLDKERGPEFAIEDQFAQQLRQQSFF